MFRDSSKDLMKMPEQSADEQRIAALEAMVQRLQERLTRLERKTQEDEG